MSDEEKYEKLKNSLFRKALATKQKVTVDVIRDAGLFEEFIIYCNLHREEKPRRIKRRRK